MEILTSCLCRLLWAELFWLSRCALCVHHYLTHYHRYDVVFVSCCIFVYMWVSCCALGVDHDHVLHDYKHVIAFVWDGLNEKCRFMKSNDESSCVLCNWCMEILISCLCGLLWVCLLRPSRCVLRVHDHENAVAFVSDDMKDKCHLIKSNYERLRLICNWCMEILFSCLCILLWADLFEPFSLYV